MKCNQRKEQYIRNGALAFLIMVAAPGIMAESRPQLSGIARDAAEELWRRGTCVLSSIVEPARRASQVPPGLTGVEVSWGRPLSMTNRITCFSEGKGYIWVATDSAVFGVDTAGKPLAKQFTVAHGLPDEPTDALHADGRILWILQRGGLAALDLDSEKFLTEGMPRFSHAKIAADGGRAWVIADTGTYIYSHGAGSWETAPAIPTGEEIARFLARGVWEGRREEGLRGLLGDPILFGGDVYIPSRGALYRLHQSSKSWSRVSGDAWKAAKSEGRVFFIGASGVGEYNPATDETVHYKVGEDIPNGRPTFLLATERDVWVALEAQPLSESHRAGAGGVARFDLRSRKWVSYREINGQKADQVTALELLGGDVWCATQNYTEVAEIVAHPGMAHIKRTRPKVEGLSLHNYVAREDRWGTLTLPIREGERRMILGQSGTYNEGSMVPRRLLALAPGTLTMLCHFDMYPRDYYSGYYPTIGLFAKRDGPGGAWEASFTNHADQLILQGEHPSVLLLSGSHGPQIVLAGGHNEVLGLFRDEAGTVWAVTEGCVAWFDESGKRWHRVVEPHYRFYWRATAAAADHENIYIGSDCGFVTRMDRRTHESEVLVCLPRRKVAQLALDDKGVLWVRTEDSPCRRLPVQLEDIPKGPDTRVVVRQGKEWVAADEWPPERKSLENRWTFEGKTNFVLRRTPSSPTGERVLFLAGVFRPEVLLHDPIDRCLWVSTFCGLVKLPIPTEATSE
jgi:hypothetical protein